MRYYDVCLHYRNKQNTGYTEGTSNLRVFGDADGCTSMYSFFYYDTWNKELKTLEKDEEVCLTFDNSGTGTAALESNGWAAALEDISDASGAGLTQYNKSGTNSLIQRV